MNFCYVLLKNRPLRSKNFKILFRKFSPRHPMTLLYSNFVKCCRWEIGEIVRYLPDKKRKFRLSLKLSIATARIAPKICQGQPTTIYSECSTFHSNRFIFGGVITERVNTAKLSRKVNLIFAQSIASTRIIIADYDFGADPFTNFCCFREIHIFFRDFH